MYEETLNAGPGHTPAISIILSKGPPHGSLSPLRCPLRTSFMGEPWNCKPSVFHELEKSIKWAAEISETRTLWGQANRIRGQAPSPLLKHLYQAVCPLVPAPASCSRPQIPHLQAKTEFTCNCLHLKHNVLRNVGTNLDSLSRTHYLTRSWRFSQGQLDL